MKVDSTVKTTRAIEVQLTEQDILMLLREQGGLFTDLPITASVVVRVPTGGDYSGETLHVGEDIQFITVRWTTTEEESL